MRPSHAKTTWRRFRAFLDFARWYFFGAVVGVIAGACSSGTHCYEVGPFYPTHPQNCLADPDCPRGQVCRFVQAKDEDRSTLLCVDGDTPW